MQRVTVVGGGLAGLTAAITAAERGADVTLLEAHEQLGGRGRTKDGPYRANLGPHVLYKDGPLWAWMRERDILPPIAAPSMTGVRVRHQGALRRTPPLSAIPLVLRLRGREAPTTRSFRDWVSDHAGPDAAAVLANAAGVYTFHHDPGALSAAFVWPRTVRTLLNAPPSARYVKGGWATMIDGLVRHARKQGVTIETGAKVDRVPTDTGPTIVATELTDAAKLLDDPKLTWPSGHTVCLDLGLRARRGDPFIVSDLDEAGWVERFSAPDPSVAPDGEELVQAQMPVRPGESIEQTTARLERLIDLSFPDYQARETWRRRQVMDGRTGAVDLPGTSWRDRPAIEHAEGVFLAGDQVAADGLLGEVAWASAVDAADRATAPSRAMSAAR